MPVLSSGFLPSGQTNNSVVNTSYGSIAAGRTNPAQMFRYANATAGPTQISYAGTDNQDWRVRISLPPNADYFYKDQKNAGLFTNNQYNQLMSPLSSSAGVGTLGVVFPYTPQISVTHTANYAAQKLTHANYTQYFYENSEVQAINISGDFTVQSIDEGQYLLATIYFFRAVTKMFFGQDNNGHAGNPPPMVFLNGYGQYYFPNVPCVVTSFSHTMPAEVDYLDVPEPRATSGGYDPAGSVLNKTRLPTTSQISISVQPIYSRNAQLKFSLQDFANGSLINQAGAGLPATAFGATRAPNFGGVIPTGGFL